MDSTRRQDVGAGAGRRSTGGGQANNNTLVEYRSLPHGNVTSSSVTTTVEQHTSA